MDVDPADAQEMMKLERDLKQMIASWEHGRVKAQDEFNADEAEAFINAYIHAPIIKVAIYPGAVRAFTILKGYRVKLRLAKPQDGIEELSWDARSLSDARDFVALVRKGQIKTALVKNGEIIEIILNEKNLP